jgi:hypothetical protein
MNQDTLKIRLKGLEAEASELEARAKLKGKTDHFKSKLKARAEGIRHAIEVINQPISAQVSNREEAPRGTAKEK